VILPIEAEELAALTFEIVADGEDLAAWVDEIIRRDPLAEGRAAEIALWMSWLKDAVDADTWRLVAEVDARVTQRWSDLASVLVRHGFEAGRRHPLLPGEEAP